MKNLLFILLLFLVSCSIPKKVQEKAQKRVNRLKDNAKTAQETLLKLEKDGVITKEAAGKAQDSIIDGLAEADTFQQKINDGVNRAAKGSNLFTKNIGGLSKSIKPLRIGGKLEQTNLE